MKTVTELAREAKLPVNHPDWAEAAQRFHAAAIAQYRESLLAGVGEPFPAGYIAQTEYFYTADQLAAAVAIERQGWIAAVKDRDAIIKQLSATAIRGQT